MYLPKKEKEQQTTKRKHIERVLRRKTIQGRIHVQYSTFLTYLGCWFVLASHATYWQLKTCWSMKHRNHVNVNKGNNKITELRNNYRLATISPFLTYLYIVRTPLISWLLKVMYSYYINIVGRDILLFISALKGNNNWSTSLQLSISRMWR
jgi:hypothetical protein